jgi:hypothetical protein
MLCRSWRIVESPNRFRGVELKRGGALDRHSLFRQATRYDPEDSMVNTIPSLVFHTLFICSSPPEAQRAKTPASAHPIIRTHPETGRKLIFANPQHSVAIEGMEERKSAEILATLFEHSTRPEFVYSHTWRVGDLTFWDNRCVQHIADHTRLDDPTYIRHMHRTTIQGEVLL